MKNIKHMKNTKQYKSNKLIHIRDGIIISLDKIDVIVKQTTDPKTGRELNNPIYVIYLTNSKYDWISISEENFEKRIKKYINNF